MHEAATGLREARRLHQHRFKKRTLEPHSSGCLDNDARTQSPGANDVNRLPHVPVDDTANSSLSKVLVQSGSTNHVTNNPDHLQSRIVRLLSTHPLFLVLPMHLRQHRDDREGETMILAPYWDPNHQLRHRRSRVDILYLRVQSIALLDGNIQVYLGQKEGAIRLLLQARQFLGRRQNDDR